MKAGAYDIFISYTIEDSAIARRIYDDLIQSDKRVKIYLFEKTEADEKRGADFWKEIIAAMNDVKYFLLIDSAKARASEWVIRECEEAMQLLDQDKIQKIIPCQIEPDGDWRKPVAAGIESAQASLFSRINRFTRINLYDYTTFDHEDIYRDEMKAICHTCDLNAKSFSDTPEAIDFQDELAGLKLDMPNKEILVNDYKYFLHRAKSDLDNAKRRLEILQNECRKLGFRITGNSMEYLKGEKIPDNVLKKLESKEILNNLFATELQFEAAVGKQLDKAELDRWKTAIFESAEKGLRFFTLDMSMAFLQIESGDEVGALATLEHITTSFRHEARGWNALGRMQTHRGAFADAVSTQNTALACIEKDVNANDIFLQSNKILVLYDKIRALIAAGDIREAIKTFEKIEETYRDSVSYLMMKAFIRIKQGYLKESEGILEKLYAIYKNETGNWAAFKLTASKIKLLRVRGLPAVLTGKLKVLEGKAFLSEKSFVETVQSLIESDLFSNHHQQILDAARYDRGFCINAYELAYLEYELSTVFLDHRCFWHALRHIKRCNEIVPDDAVHKSDLALLQHAAESPAHNTIMEALALDFDGIRDKDIYLGRLYYLLGDLAKAKSLLKNTDQLAKYIRDLKEMAKQKYCKDFGKTDSSFYRIIGGAIRRFLSFFGIMAAL